MHPGFAESVSLEVGSSFDTHQAVKLSGLNSGAQPSDCHWIGTCKADGSAFRIFLEARALVNLVSMLKVVIEGTRSVED